MVGLCGHALSGVEFACLPACLLRLMARGTVHCRPGRG